MFLWVLVLAHPDCPDKGRLNGCYYHQLPPLTPVISWNDNYHLEIPVPYRSYSTQSIQCFLAFLKVFKLLSSHANTCYMTLLRFVRFHCFHCRCFVHYNNNKPCQQIIVTFCAGLANVRHIFLGYAWLLTDTWNMSSYFRCIYQILVLSCIIFVL